MFVVDASAVVHACLAAAGFGLFGAAQRLVAPALLWSEACSVIHEVRWRREISDELATTAFEALVRAPVAKQEPRALRREAWRIATDLGWAKTYDAEYVALAHILGCPLFTVDERLRRVAARVVEVVGPRDL